MWTYLLYLVQVFCWKVEEAIPSDSCRWTNEDLNKSQGHQINQRPSSEIGTEREEHRAKNREERVE
jgi:hypothetical protein